MGKDLIEMEGSVVYDNFFLDSKLVTIPNNSGSLKNFHFCIAVLIILRYRILSTFLFLKF